jgi:hypothetical protein
MTGEAGHTNERGSTRRGRLPPSGFRSVFARRPFSQSVHFANDNLPKSMKTSHQEIFNRYTFCRFSTAACERRATPYLVLPCLRPIFSTPQENPILAPGLEIDAND